MLLSTLGAILLGNLSPCKGTVSVKVDLEQMRALQMSRSEFLMPPKPLTNFEIQTYYQSEPKFNGIYSRNN